MRVLAPMRSAMLAPGSAVPLRLELLASAALIRLSAVTLANTGAAGAVVSTIKPALLRTSVWFRVTAAFPAKSLKIAPLACRLLAAMLIPLVSVWPGKIL